MLDKINNDIFALSVYKQQINDKNSFYNELSLNTKEEKSSHTNELSYENIKGINLEEIENNFINDDNKAMAKSLRLATLFSEDEVLSQALFNTVLGHPFDIGFSILSNRYSDKNIFLNHKNKDKSFTSLLHNSLLNKNESISKDKIDEILLKTQSINFLDHLLSNSKDQYGRYKDDKDNDYGFLYNDYVLQYEELSLKYKNIKNINKNIISQF
ncbi:MAG: hypothetical protein HRT40_03470 [Campylobacteraceae bacterium]|nr:hypothetical protein [Campylobacteraceae bacterium]